MGLVFQFPERHFLGHTLFDVRTPSFHACQCGRKAKSVLQSSLNLQASALTCNEVQAQPTVRQVQYEDMPDCGPPYVHALMPKPKCRS